MDESIRPRRIGRGGVLVIVAIVVTVIGALVVGIGQMRESARRNECLARLKEIGEALHNYHDSQGGFPASANPVADKKQDANGYSFLFELLPAFPGPLYDQIRALETGTTHDPMCNTNARTVGKDWWTCPSYAGPRYMDENKRELAITNYKAMSATHKESLAHATDPRVTPKYGAPEQHPDGGLIPLRKLKRREFIDGTAETILVTETIDQTGSYWAAGNTASLVALPSTVDYIKVPGPYPYWAPAGFVFGQYDDEAQYDNPATYFNWDYRTAGMYDEAKKITFGPSSAHPGVINCSFGDGRSRSVAKTIDQGILMFLVTRAGRDPTDDVGWHPWRTGG